MNKQLYSKDWQRLEQCTQYYWRMLQELPQEVLRQQPAEEKWSILQIAEHLAGAESACVQYLLRRNYTSLAPRGLPASVRNLMLQLALKSPLKFKAPALDALKPHNNSRPAELLLHWQQTREKLANYLEQMPSQKEQSLLFRHPLAGALNIQQTLQFMAEHLNHHKRQVKLILKQ